MYTAQIRVQTIGSEIDMNYDELETYDTASEPFMYTDDDSVNYKPALKTNDKIRADKRRRLDELLEERRLKSELDLYKDPAGLFSGRDDLFSEL